jgi:hypothetical protein
MQINIMKVIGVVFAASISVHQKQEGRNKETKQRTKERK